MLYDISVKLKFAKKSDSDEVWSRLKGYLKNKDIRNVAEEKSFIYYHECNHDTGEACKTIERFEN